MAEPIEKLEAVSVREATENGPLTIIIRGFLTSKKKKYLCHLVKSNP